MSTEVEDEPKERKKIHFAMPSSAPTNLDPRQVEMVSPASALTSLRVSHFNCFHVNICASLSYLLKKMCSIVYEVHDHC